MALEVGQLVAILALKDLLTPALADAGKAVDGFEGKWGESMRTLGTVAGFGVTAIGGLVAGIVALGSRGADVADIHAQFDVLNRNIGNTGDVLGTLRTAFDGTISDFEIMESTNKGLSQGLVLTESQMKLTAETARVLADRTGGDTKTAFDALNMVMATGADRALKTIGLNIDGTAAVEKYAASIGREASELTEAQQIEAKRAAVLAEMANVLAVSGLAETDFADRMAQGKAVMQNFTDALAVAVAESPALGAALGIIGDALQAAFGANQGDMVQTLAGYVGDFAILLTRVADVGIEAGRLLGNIWYGVNAVFNALLSTVASGAATVVSALASVAEMEAKLGLISKETAQEARAVADGLTSYAQLSQKATEEALVSQDKFNSKMDAAKGFVGNLRTAMEGATGATVKLGDATVSTGARATTAIGLTAKEAAKWELTMLDTIKTQRQLAEDTMTAISTNTINKMMAERTERIEAAAVAYDGMLHAQIEADQQATAAAEELADAENAKFEARIEGFRMLGEVIGGSFGAAISSAASAVGNYASEMANATTKGEEFKAKVGLASAAAGILGSMLESKASPAAQKFGGALSGAAQGAKIGTAILPGWGTAIGAAAGAIFGFLSKAKKLREELVKIKDGFVDSMGGMDALKLHAAEAGIALDKIWQAKDKKHLLDAIDEVKEKLKTWDEAQEQLNAAVEKYGFTIDELGPKFAQQKLDVMAADLLRDFKLLDAAGVDHLAILSRMGPEFGKYVDQAVASGTSIPMAMKPVIDEMFKAGTLIHENGEAFTQAEYEGLSFSQTMTEQFQTLIDKIDEMVSALLGMPTSHTTTFTTRHEDEYATTGGDRHRDGPPEEYAAASGFSGWVNGPTRFLAGEEGPEHVQITPSGKTMAGSGDSSALLNEIRGLRRDLAPSLAKAVRHAIQTA